MVRTRSDKICGYYTQPISYRGSPYNLPFIYFISGQCTYDKAGSCVMCNFGRSVPIDSNAVIQSVSEIIKSFKGSPAIFITPSGSLFDNAEVPRNVRLQIFELIKQSGFEAVKTESRPEFLTPGKLHEIRDVLGYNIDLEIGLGLESSNPWILKNCINKMLTLSSIERAIQICHEYSATAYTHIFTKPPFLNEVEAVHDAISTAKWAFKAGADLIGMALANIKPQTVTERMLQYGIYELPSLWTLISIVAQLPSEIRNRTNIFGFDSAVPIVHAMSSCPSCERNLREMLAGWCYTGDFRFIQEANEYPCTCKQTWKANMDQSTKDLPITERVRGYYEILALEVYGENWWQENSIQVMRQLNEDSLVY